MDLNSEQIRKMIFLSYDEILEELNKNGNQTKQGKIISHKDLRTAILTMNKKHSSCRWQSEKIKSKYYYIQYEGFVWLRDVYFSNYETKFIDKDVEWFERRIVWYQKNLASNNIEYPSFIIQVRDMSKNEMVKYFNKSLTTIKKALREMNKETKQCYEIITNGIVYVSAQGIEWLLKNKFKKKYISILEIYKMQLTEIFKDNGGLYDEYLNRN